MPSASVKANTGMPARAPGDLWQEVLRTAELIRRYQPLLETIEEKMFDGLTGEDADALVEVVSDAQILVSLISQLERQWPAFRE